MSTEIDHIEIKCKKSENWSNWCKCVQAVFISLGILGGFISYFTLNKSLQEKLTIEGIRKAVREISILSVDIKSMQVPGSDEGFKVIANIEMGNIGNASEIIKRHETKLRVARAEIQSDGTTTFKDIQNIKFVEPLEEGETGEAELEIMPNEKVLFPFAFSVKKPGAYFLTFTVTTSESESYLTGEGHSENYEYTWFGWRYLLLGEENVIVNNTK